MHPLCTKYPRSLNHKRYSLPLRLEQTPDAKPLPQSGKSKPPFCEHCNGGGLAMLLPYGGVHIMCIHFAPSFHLLMGKALEEGSSSSSRPQRGIWQWCDGIGEAEVRCECSDLDSK